MPNIPTVPGYAYAQTPSGGAQASMAGASAIAQGVASLGGAVQNVSNVLFEYKQKKQHAIDIGAMADFSTMRDKAEIDFSRRVAHDPELRDNPELIPHEWAKVTDGFKDYVNDPKYKALSKEAKQQLGISYSQWKVSTGGHYQEMADKITFGNVASSMIEAAQMKAAEGKFDEAKGHLDHALAVGAITPKMHSHEEQRLGALSESSMIDEMLTSDNASDAKTAVDMLKHDKFTYLKPDAVLAKTRQAETQLNKLQGRNASQAIDFMSSASEAVRIAAINEYTDEHINDLVKNNQLSPSMAVSVRGKRNALVKADDKIKEPAIQAGIFDRISRDIGQFAPQIDAGDHQAALSKLETMDGFHRLNADQKRSLEHLVNSRYDEYKGGDSMMVKKVTIALHNGLFGSRKTDDEKQTTQKIYDDKIKALMLWHRNNPNASNDELEEKANDLISNSVSMENATIDNE